MTLDVFRGKPMAQIHTLKPLLVCAVYGKLLCSMHLSQTVS